MLKFSDVVDIKYRNVNNELKTLDAVLCTVFSLLRCFGLTQVACLLGQRARRRSAWCATVR